MKFLIVDDEPIILRLMTEVLIGFGYEDIVCAQGGYEALQILGKAHTRFDCFMLDIQMPQIDGIELCRTIRSMPGYASTPIIMSTVMRDIGHIKRAFAAGATDYTIKPFDVIELIERVRLAEIITDPEQARQMAMIRSRSLEDQKAPDILVSRTALENYVRNCRQQNLTLPAAIAFKVPPDEGFGVNDVACVLGRIFNGHEIFLSYQGDGEFLMLCDRHAVIAEETLESLLGKDLARMRAEIGDEPAPQIDLGSWTYPRAFSRSGEARFLDRALADRRSAGRHKGLVLAEQFANRLLKAR